MRGKLELIPKFRRERIDFGTGSKDRKWPQIFVKTKQNFQVIPKEMRALWMVLLIRNWNS